MAKGSRNALALACLCIVSWQAPTADSQNTDGAGSHGNDRLGMVVILSRHGVRSPTWAQTRLDQYSAQLWPKWSVPPGELTSRGYELIRLFGSFDRASLAKTGLVAARGCEDAAKTYIWADTTQRTILSGKALAEGLFPGCPPQVHALSNNVNDPLFHPTANRMNSAEADAPSGLAKQADPQTDGQQRELLDEMQHVLLGCDPKAACSAASQPQNPLFQPPLAVARATAGNMIDTESPLGLASSFAEDFLLEYAEGMPMDQVGWGKVDEFQLRRFLSLHTQYFNVAHRSPALARLQASNLLFHIERTLQQGVEGKPVGAAIGPPQSKLVILAGHDTNLAGVAAMLGLHWTLDGRLDDTPPGIEMFFELWQDVHGAYSIRISVATQTLRQMREMTKLNSASPPAQTALAVPGCNGGNGTCSWKDFGKIAEMAVDKNAVTAEPN